MDCSAKPGIRAHALNTRQGAVLVIVMVCLMIISLLMASLLKSALLQRRQIIKEQYRVQAEWILESALERAALQRLLDPKYQGEVWKINPAELGTGFAGSAEISIKRQGKDDSQTLIQARVTYPEQTPFSVTRTKRVIL